PDQISPNLNIGNVVPPNVEFKNTRPDGIASSVIGKPDSEKISPSFGPMDFLCHTSQMLGFQTSRPYIFYQGRMCDLLRFMKNIKVTRLRRCFRLYRRHITINGLI